jgi:hypothetical protein
MFRSQPKQIVPDTLSQKNPSHIQKEAGVVAQGVGPDFKQTNKKNMVKVETGLL